RAAYVGSERPAPSTCPLRDSGRWSFARSSTVDSPTLCILSTCEGAQPCVPWQVHGRTEESVPEKAVDLSRQSSALGARSGLLFFTSFALPPRLGSVRQAAVRRPAARSSLSGPLHPSCRDFQPSARKLRRWPGHFPLEGLCTWQQAETDDRDSGRVPAPLSSPCASARLRPYPLLRLPGQPQAQNLIADLPTTAADAPAHLSECYPP